MTTARETLDEESASWLRELRGRDREAACERLHELLLRIARAELGRRRRRTSISGPELDDLAHQAAADALVAIVAKLDQFRGESRFTTWAFRFVILEVSSKLGRHFWRHRSTVMGDEDWDRLPARFGFDPQQRAEWQDLVGALRRAVDHELTPHQRRVFVALVLHEIPLDALVIELGSNRNAIYKSLFDARRKLRRSLVANGYMHLDTSVSS
jgi:RNA polymerase sigma-70 factor (ECF subfamily)